MDVSGYLHRANHNVVLYDVPGLDAVQHTREKYLDVIKYNDHQYDLFLIITKDVFSSDAKFIADQIGIQRDYLAYDASRS